MHESTICQAERVNERAGSGLLLATAVVRTKLAGVQIPVNERLPMMTQRVTILKSSTSQLPNSSTRSTAPPALLSSLAR